MTGKNKLMVAAAIAAVLLLVGSGIARCSLNSQHDQASEEPQGTEQAQGEWQETQLPEQGPGLADYIGTSWVGSEDATLTLFIVNGAFVEGKEGQNTVTYWTVDTEEQDDGTLVSTVMASKSMTEAATPVLVTVYEETGRTCIKSDALATTYVSVQTEPKELSFLGVTSKLEESLGADAAKVEAAVASRAAVVSPNATRAVWDAEVWIDFANNVATTSFTLEDGASTPVTVTRNADGSIEAL